MFSMECEGPERKLQRKNLKYVGSKNWPYILNFIILAYRTRYGNLNPQVTKVL